MNSLPPTVSIIVPMYNAEAYVGDAIQSVIDQTYSSWELLLIDDGSTDRTAQIAKTFLDDRRIKYAYKKNEGPASARNVGIYMARGTYLAFIDADDLWDEHKLQSQLEVLQRDDVDLVYSKLRGIAGDGSLLNRIFGGGTGLYQGFASLFLLIAGNIAIPNSSVIVERRWVNRAGNFNENEEARDMEDYELLFRLLIAGATFYGMNEIVGSYRRHANQITHRDTGQSIEMINYLNILCKKYPRKKLFFKYLILQRLLSFYKKQNCKREAKAECLRIYYSNVNIDRYWIDNFFIKMLNLRNYLKLRMLLIRKFRRYKTFVQLITTH